MTRFVVAALVLASGVAYADQGSLPNGVVLKWNRLFTHDADGNQIQPNLGTEDEWHYFNFAHCQCALEKGTGGSFKEGTFEYEIVTSSSGSGTVPRPGQIWVGTMCDDTSGTGATTRANMCKHLSKSDIGTIGQIQASHTVTPEISIFDLMTPTGSSVCPEEVASRTEYLLVDTMGTGSIDYSISVGINTDSLAPPLPLAFNVTGAENAINVRWKAADGSTGDQTDTLYFQALCSTMDGQPAVDSKYRPSAKYITPNSLCESEYLLGITQSDDDQDITPSTTTTTGLDAGTIDAVTNFAPAGDDAPLDAPMADAMPTGADASVIDAPSQPSGIPAGFSNYDPSFLCGEADSATATALRIDHLQNYTDYRVMLLVIDKYGNVRGTVFKDVFTPKPVTDFWEDLHDRGSKVEGGFCLLAETYGNDNWPTSQLRKFRDETLASSAFGRWVTDAYYATLGKLGPYVHGHLALRIVAGVLLAPLVALALVWHYLTLAGLLALLAFPLLWRHRRKVLRSRAMAAATMVTVVCFASRAHADDDPDGKTYTAAPASDDDQTTYKAAPEKPEEPTVKGNGDEKADPTKHAYWTKDNGDITLADEPKLVRWQAGIRVGPYTPAIDSQLGQPVYKQMFGDSLSLMPMIDFDRVVWHGSGMVAVGVTFGYMHKSAFAYLDMTQPSNDRPRSSGDGTSFSLVPFAVTASYRADQLDDMYGIPIVPFARLGLAYYVWWIKAPSGDIATIDGSNQARGASMGITGELGFTVRAERIDADAARSMREGGLQHAGFFAEYQLAKVDGFGSDKKLAVGSNTWFAGVNFEF